MSVILYGFLAIVVARGRSSALRWTCFIAVLLISFVIAISRLYLGAHWLSDVLGGFLVGTSWTALLGIAYLKTPDENLPRRLLALVTVLVVAVAGGWRVSRHHEKDLAFYAPRHDVQTMLLATWLADGWRELPAWRIDMAGEREQPLTIQSAGPPAELARFLSTRGWQRPPAMNLKNFLGMLSPDTPVEKLPVLRRLHDGRFDRLSLVREADGQRWVLRLWPTDVKAPATDTPLFVGTIEVQSKRHLPGLITLARDTGEYNRPLESVAQVLGERFAVKSVVRTGDSARADPDHLRVDWQGKVLLVWEITGGR
jgi:undecaprenyl-diphosphatase